MTISVLLFAKLTYESNLELYICIVLVNIRNIYVKYPYCGPTHLHAKEIQCRCISFFLYSKVTNSSCCKWS